jgi:hypothetical protein
MDLPKNEKTFTFEQVGEVTGKKYDGEFTVKCVLTMFDKREVELKKTQLVSDSQNPTSLLSSISHIIATLQVRVLKAPTWWEQSADGLDILDENIVIELYDKVVAQESIWKDELKAQIGETSGNPQKES